MKRREFIPGVLAAAVATQLPLAGLAGAVPSGLPHAATAQPGDDVFWEQIRALYRTGPNINLNNGGVSPSPLPVEEAFFNYFRVCNDVPSLSMRLMQDGQKNLVREKLAQLGGCLPSEIAINRNATEALVTIIMNIPLKRGDEVVLSTFDYPRMMNAWKIRAEKEGLKLRWVDPETGNPTKADLVNRYISLFNKKTKVVHLTHMINWTGRIIPVKEIIDEAKKTGIATVVDAAHSFAHVPFSISELGCDYLGVSLHKWLGAPLGNGMLFVREDRIESQPAIFPVENSLKASIKKFEELGTRNLPAEFAISEAVEFHNLMGTQKKYDRLVELRNHWINQVKNHPNIRVYTPLEPGTSGAICLIGVGNHKPYFVDNTLLSRYHIHTVGIIHEHVSGNRVTPNVYTTKAELDLLAEGLLVLADKA